MYQILLVDDQMDARQMLRASLESLGPAVRVIDVPSGEEALLVYTRQAIDLVVIDMRLAGMNGLELMAKLRKRRPDLHVVMVTGVSDPHVRDQVSHSAADAVFFKPVVLADFLDTIERLLGMAAGALTVAEQPKLVPDTPQLSLPQTLSNLRQQLSAVTVALLDHAGRVAARAGELPDNRLEAQLLPAVTILLDASQKVALKLENPAPQDVLCVAGEKFDLHCAHVGSGAALVVVTGRLDREEARLEVMRTMRVAVSSLATYLPAVRPGDQSQTGVEEPYPAARFEDTQGETGGEVDPELKNLIDQARPGELKPEEFDSLWQVLSGDDQPGHGLNAGAISYEQARRLGLLPDDGES